MLKELNSLHQPSRDINIWKQQKNLIISANNVFFKSIKRVRIAINPKTKSLTLLKSEDRGQRLYRASNKFKIVLPFLSEFLGNFDIKDYKIRPNFIMIRFKEKQNV